MATQYITEINQKYVDALHFIPDPHTVTLKDHGHWMGYFYEGKCVAVACWRRQRGSIYFGTLFTHQNYRKMGIQTKLVKHIMDMHPGESFTAYAIHTSLNMFLKLGFKEVSSKEFTHYTHHYMKKEAQNGTTKN